MARQSSSHLQTESEEFERAVMLLISSVIWELMFTVLYSGGCKFFEGLPCSSLYCPVLPGFGHSQLLSIQICVWNKHGENWEIKLSSLGCKYLQTVQVVELMLTYQFFHCFVLQLNSEGRGKWIKKRRNRLSLAACCRQKLWKKRTRFLFSLRIIALPYSWLQAGIEVINSIKCHGEAEQKVYGCLCLWTGEGQVLSSCCALAGTACETAAPTKRHPGKHTFNFETKRF